MKEYFIDTSFLIALANKDDKYSIQANNLFSDFADDDEIRFRISDYIVDEFLTLISRLTDMNLALRWGEYLFNEKWFDLVYTPSTVVLDAWDLFKQEYNERNPLSFTDCTVIAYCKLFKIKNALTFDERLGNYLQ